MDNWQNLPKNQEDAEKIEEAIDRKIGDHLDDPNAHIEDGQSLADHRSAKVVDHLARSIVGDKINNVDTVFCHDHLSEIATVETIAKTKRLTFTHTPDDNFDITDRIAGFLTGTGAGKVLVPYGNGDICLAECSPAETWSNTTNSNNIQFNYDLNKRMDVPTNTLLESVFTLTPQNPFNLSTYINKTLKMEAKSPSDPSHFEADGIRIRFRDNTNKLRDYDITSQVNQVGQVTVSVNLNAYTETAGFDPTHVVSVGIRIKTTTAGTGIVEFADMRIIMNDDTKTSYRTADVGAVGVGDELFFTKLIVHQTTRRPDIYLNDGLAFNGHSVRLIETDSYFEFTKECDRIEIYGYVGAWSGIVDLYIDGVYEETIDLYNDDGESVLPIFERQFETTASRTFKIVLTGDMNPLSNDSSMTLAFIDTNGIIDYSSLRILRMRQYHYFNSEDGVEQTFSVNAPAGYSVLASVGTLNAIAINSDGTLTVTEAYAEAGVGAVNVKSAIATGYVELEFNSYWLIVKNDDMWENTSE